MNSIRFAWTQPGAAAGFRTGVSLHSHTLHSLENLNFIPRVAARIPALASALTRQHEKYRDIHGHELDLKNAFWTPPLSAHEAYRLEASQIGSLGLRALVSLSDHDTIEAAGRLRMLRETDDAPVSVEWTVPFHESFFHLGIHNLPADRAHAMMEAMAEFTVRPQLERLPEILEWISWNEGVLVIFNHPCWDEKGVGRERHRSLVQGVLGICGRYIHAFELNGLRPWEENRRVLALAKSVGRPIISGGDRHGFEPNANINLTNARTFGEFAAEVRNENLSHVLFMEQYAEALPVRQIRCIAHVLGDQPNHSLGLARWNDRVFYRHPSGEMQPLSTAWKRGAPWIVSWFVNLVRLSQQRHVQNALKTWLPSQREYAI